MGPELGLEMRSVTTAVLICSRGSLSHPPPHAEPPCAAGAGRMVYSHGCVRDKTDTALASANLGSRDRRRMLSCWRGALLAKPGLRLTRCKGGGGGGRSIQVQPHARHPPSSLAGRQRNHKGRGSAISPLNRAQLVPGAARQGRTAGLWDAYTFGELEPRPARP